MGKLERITVDVSSEMADALRQSVKSGAYVSEGLAVDDALHDWVRSQGSDEAKLAWLRAAIKEGVDSGPGIPAEEVCAQLRELIASQEQAA